MFVSEAEAYISEAPFKCFTLGWSVSLFCKHFKLSLMFFGKPSGCSTVECSSGRTHKHKTRQEKLARNKHSSFLRIFVNYVPKKFIIFGSGVSQAHTVKLLGTVTNFAPQ